MDPQLEIEQIRSARAAKGGRYTKVEKARLEELEKQMSDQAVGSTESAPDVPVAPEPEKEPEATSEAPQRPEFDFSGDLVRIMIRHHNLGLPCASGKVHKALRFDVADVPSAFAAMVIEREHAAETKDDPTVDLKAL